MIIAFKNGDKIKVSEAVVSKLYEAIVVNPNGAKNFQFFTAEETMQVMLVINVSEISSISSKENIL